MHNRVEVLREEYALPMKTREQYIQIVDPIGFEVLLGYLPSGSTLERRQEIVECDLLRVAQIWVVSPFLPYEARSQDFPGGRSRVSLPFPG